MKTRLPHYLTVVGLFLAAVGLSAPAYAEIRNTADCAPEWSYTTEPGWTHCTYFAEDRYGLVSGFADDGVLKARAEASADKTATSMRVGATIEMSQYLTFNSAGLTGQPGRAITTSAVHGSTLMSPTGIGHLEAAGGVGLRIGSNTYSRLLGTTLNTDSEGSHEVQTAWGTENGTPVPYTDLIPTSWEFIWGEPFLVTVTMSVAAVAVGHGLAGSYFDRSWYWTGVQSVTTFEGASVPYTLTSESGVDWSRSFATPVPEPASTILFPLGLLIVGAAARTRSRRR